MEIVERIQTRMQTEGITEEILSEMTGIEEHNIYYLLTYQQYISKIAVIVLDKVLMLGVEDIESEIERNRAKVGAPETNLKIAHNMVDPAYVERLHKEITGLSRNKGDLQSKNRHIEELVRELKDKQYEIEELQERVRTSKAEGYREGNRKGAESVEQMRAISIEKEIKEITGTYETKLKNTERVLREERELYERFYKYVYKDGTVDIRDFKLPYGYTEERIKKEIQSKEDKAKEKEENEQMQLVYELTHALGMEQEDIETEMGITAEQYSNLYKRYKEKIEGLTQDV